MRERAGDHHQKVCRAENRSGDAKAFCREALISYTSGSMAPGTAVAHVLVFLSVCLSICVCIQDVAVLAVRWRAPPRFSIWLLESSAVIQRTSVYAWTRVLRTPGSPLSSSERRSKQDSQMQDIIQQLYWLWPQSSLVMLESFEPCVLNHAKEKASTLQLPEL